MKPPIQYFGAKGNIASDIVALMPPHQGYIEPYAGSLSVLLEKAPTRVEVVNDLDHRLMTFWRVLRDRGPELLHLAELTPHSRAELEAATELDADDDLELARQVWVLLTQGRSRTMKRSGWRFYADPRGNGSSFQTYMDAYRARISPVIERLRNVTLECRPALDVIAQYGAFADNLIYVDPPYVIRTRSSAYGSRYVHEMNDTDHRDLASALAECEATVMLSGYAGPLYDELFADWFRVDIAARSDNAVDRSRTEVVWSNREIGNFLFHESTLTRPRVGGVS